MPVTSATRQGKLTSPRELLSEPLGDDALRHCPSLILSVSTQVWLAVCRLGQRSSGLLYPPSERSKTGGYAVFTFVCLSVRTQSMKYNRLCTSRWSPRRHRCTACCGKSILRDITVTFFCTFLLKLHFYLEPDYIIRKPIKRSFQQYLDRTEILSTFHARVEYISRRTIRHSAHSNEWGALSPVFNSVCPSHNASATWRTYVLSERLIAVNSFIVMHWTTFGNVRSFYVFTLHFLLCVTGWTKPSADDDWSNHRGKKSTY